MSIDDGRGGTAAAGVVVPVSPAGSTGANHAPTATVTVGSPDPVTGVVTGRVIGSDVDGDPLTYQVRRRRAGAVVVGISGSFTYTPTDTARTNAASRPPLPADLQDNFTVSIDDGRGGTAAAGVVFRSARPAAPPQHWWRSPAPGFRRLRYRGARRRRHLRHQPSTPTVRVRCSGQSISPGPAHPVQGQRRDQHPDPPDQRGRHHRRTNLTGWDHSAGLRHRRDPYQDQAVQMPADFAENWILQHIRIRPGTGDLSDDGLRIRYTRQMRSSTMSRSANANDEAIGSPTPTTSPSRTPSSPKPSAGDCSTAGC